MVASTPEAGRVNSLRAVAVLSAASHAATARGTEPPGSGCTTLSGRICSNTAVSIEISFSASNDSAFSRSSSRRPSTAVWLVTPSGSILGIVQLPSMGRAADAVTAKLIVSVVGSCSCTSSMLGPPSAASSTPQRATSGAETSVTSSPAGSRKRKRSTAPRSTRIVSTACSRSADSVTSSTTTLLASTTCWLAVVRLFRDIARVCSPRTTGSSKRVSSAAGS